jgi:hypothetical protein
MARDKGMEAMLADDLKAVVGLTQKSMFGGMAWMLHDRLLCCAGSTGLLYRVGLEAAQQALSTPGVTPMLSGKRLMKGWVRVQHEACAEDALRERLLQDALTFVCSLPPR